MALVHQIILVAMVALELFLLSLVHLCNMQVVEEVEVKNILILTPVLELLVVAMVQLGLILGLLETPVLAV